jgi:hypothetical protein
MKFKVKIIKEALTQKAMIDKRNFDAIGDSGMYSSWKDLEQNNPEQAKAMMDTFVDEPTMKSPMIGLMEELGFEPNGQNPIYTHNKTWGPMNTQGVQRRDAFQRITTVGGQDYMFDIMITTYCVAADPNGEKTKLEQYADVHCALLPRTNRPGVLSENLKEVTIIDRNFRPDHEFAKLVYLYHSSPALIQKIRDIVTKSEYF